MLLKCIYYYKIKQFLNNNFFKNNESKLQMDRPKEKKHRTKYYSSVVWNIISTLIATRNRSDKSGSATAITDFGKILCRPWSVRGVTRSIWIRLPHRGFLIRASCASKATTRRESSLCNEQLWKFNYASPWARVRGHNVRRLLHCRRTESKRHERPLRAGKTNVS